MTEKQYSDIDKLQTMISHWLHHNESHGREYAKWAEVARQAGHDATAAYIEQAGELLAQADKAFEKALESVGKTSSGHQPHHHHGHGHD